MDQRQNRKLLEQLEEQKKRLRGIPTHHGSVLPNATSPGAAAVIRKPKADSFVTAKAAQKLGRRVRRPEQTPYGPRVQVEDEKGHLDPFLELDPDYLDKQKISVPVPLPPQINPISSTLISETQHMTPAQRAALQHANANSVGFFITQDSSFGNLILPVLPRFEK